MATFSKKAYEVIASAIRNEAALAGEGWEKQPMTAEGFSRRIADLFARDNARFDRERFLSACGL